jgi:hypothetical protein
MMSGLDFSLNRLYQYSDAATPPLRIGVMVDGLRANRYARQIMLDIVGSNFASLVCVIENSPPERESAKPALWKRVVRTFTDHDRRRSLLYRAYLRWIDAPYRRDPDPIEVVDCSDLLEHLPRIRVTPTRTRFVDRFPEHSLAEIRAQNLDVIFRFGFRIIRGDVLHTARHGVWSYHHDDSSRYRGGPAQLWELIEGNPVSGAVLQRLEDALDAGPVLGRVILSSASVPSVSVNRFNVYWTTQHLAIQKLYELHRYGPEHLARRTLQDRSYAGRKPLYRIPDNFEMGRWLAPKILRKAVRSVVNDEPKLPHWRIAVRRAQQPLHRESHPDLARFRWVRGPRGRFWADPFLLEQNGTTWAFFEDYDYGQKKANIACGRLDGQGEIVEVRTVLERPYHLSYPHVFTHEGVAWMVPETYRSGAIELYRAVRFPDEWVLDRTLLELSAADPTPFFHAGRWWMFACPSTVGTHLPLTLLFTAPQLHGPWSLHPASPICSHVRWSRSAGQVFEDDGHLVRPSQDCANGYGYSVSFNRITRLNEQEYEEQRGVTILPRSVPGLAGFHTYNRVGEWEIVDGKFPLPEREIA